MTRFANVVPRALLSLLMISPLHASSQDALTCTFDPFFHFRRHSASLLPMCTLAPPPSEPAPEFLSFEEWKAQQLAMQEENRDGGAGKVPNYTGVDPDLPRVDQPAPDVPTTSIVADSHPSPPDPYSLIPLTDRFNYASLDCSARIHTAHKSAKSPASILSSKKDRYMLSPCSATGKHVVVELCDDIRIDTIQLANYEFFSGVFKDVRVSVAQTYTGDSSQSWVLVGEYRAKNIRGVQSFHPLTELRPFYRYIKIEFLSHYGAEYYCPVSLLRVFGLTQMEEWKRDIWEAEWRAKDVNRAVQTPAPPPPVETVDVSVTKVEEVKPTATETAIPTATEVALIAVETTKRVKGQRDELDSPSKSLAAKSTGSGNAKDMDASSTQTECSAPPQTPVSAPPTTAEPSLSTPAAEQSNTVQASTATASSTRSSSATSISSEQSSQHKPDTATTPTETPIRASRTILTVPIATPSNSLSGESIYRTIMNRLITLEMNTTLYARYVEEQTRTVRVALSRLEEDVGRLEGITKAQQVLFQKAITEWEKQRKDMEIEHKLLVSKVHSLADEVTLEKRLGVAQLCLLLMVLIFMAVTRGSPAESYFIENGRARRIGSRSVGARRGSGDWKFPLSGKDTSQQASVPIASPLPPRTRSVPRDRANSLSWSELNATPTARTRKTSRSGPSHRIPSRPTTPTPFSRGLQAVRASTSFSGRTPGSSAQKLARTAHLHEVRVVRNRKLVEEIDLSPDAKGPNASEPGVEAELIAVPFPRTDSTTLHPPASKATSEDPSDTRDSSQDTSATESEDAWVDESDKDEDAQDILVRDVSTDSTVVALSPPPRPSKKLYKAVSTALEWC